MNTRMQGLTGPRLVGVAEMAAVLGVAESWVYSQSKVGAIPTVRVGRYLRFDVEEVLRYLATEKEAARRARAQ